VNGSSAWLALALSIAASVVGQTLLKAAAQAGDFRAQLLDLRSLCGLAAYGLAALFYMLALRRLPMSVALPCTAVTYLVAVLIGHAVFRERLNLIQAGGVAAIGVGVVMLGVGSS
jgi:multidrug transporter EmrE-like cation transporter